MDEGGERLHPCLLVVAGGHAILGEGAEVHTGTERPVPCPRQHDRPHLFVRLGFP